MQDTSDPESVPLEFQEDATPTLETLPTSNPVEDIPQPTEQRIEATTPQETASALTPPTVPATTPETLSTNLTPIGLSQEEEDFAYFLFKGKSVINAYLQAFKLERPVERRELSRLSMRGFALSGSKKVLQRVFDLREARANREIMTVAERKAALCKIANMNTGADALQILNDNASGNRDKRHAGAVLQATRSITGDIAGIRVNGPGIVLDAIRELNKMEGVGGSGPSEFSIAIQNNLSGQHNLPVASDQLPAFGAYAVPLETSLQAENPAMPSQGGNGQNAV